MVDHLEACTMARQPRLSGRRSQVLTRPLVGQSAGRSPRIAWYARVCTDFGVCTLLTCGVWGQPRVQSPIPATDQPSASQDLLGRATPRGTVLGFLSAARKKNDERAIQYLNTPLKHERAVELAYQLFEVLNRRLPARLNELSDRPEGSKEIQAQPNTELVGIISSDFSDVEIELERVDQKKNGLIWLFSKKTLEQIPELFAETDTSGIDNTFIKYLLDTRVAHIALFEWISFFGGIPLFFYAIRFLNRLLSSCFGEIRRLLRHRPELPNPEVLSGPIRLLLLVLIIHWILSSLSLPILERQFWSATAALITIAASVWLVIWLNGRGEHYIRLRLGRTNRAGALSILRFVRRAADLVVVFVGLLVAFRKFGINPTTALAGLGVGGIAVALAAQKTLENVIAGISLILDHAIRVGDFLKAGDTAGTVTDIGLRSTCIRTLDRTVVTVPNGQIANANLENMSLRDQYWFHHMLNLGYETDASQMRSILQTVTNMLRKHSNVDATSVRARFLAFGVSSLDIELFAYFFAHDWLQFLEIQEALLLEIMDIVQAAGARRALPSRLMYSAGSAGSDSAALATPHTEANFPVAPTQAPTAASPRRRRSRAVVQAEPSAGISRD